MTFPYKTFLRNIGINSSSDTVYSVLDIETRDISILLLCLLYHNKLITQKQLCLHCNRYQEIKTDEITKYTEYSLSRRLNTYHSKITNTWYNDCNFTYVLYEDCLEKCINTTMSIDELLKILNIGFSKNRNWCVDYIAFNIIKPIINYYDKNYSYNFLKEFGIHIDFMTYEEADIKHDLSLGYCCQDCDGCYSQYKQNQYEYKYMGTNKERVLNSFKGNLLSYKKHLKNPYDKLLYNW